MKELFKKLMEAGREDALESLEALEKAAGEFGYTREQIDEALDGFDGFPLGDDDLEEIQGGRSVSRASYSNRRLKPTSY